MVTSLSSPIETTESVEDSFVEGALLLCLEGNAVFSLNESGLVVWRELERNAEGVSVERLIECLFGYYADSGVERSRVAGDVESLVDTLVKRGFLLSVRSKGSSLKLQIKGDVFRSGGNRPAEGQGEAVFDEAIAYRPEENVCGGLLRRVCDTWTAIFALLAYEVVLRVFGFAKVCELVERFPVRSGGKWSAVRVRQVSGGVDRARLWYPKLVQCLQHSVVVTCLMRRVSAPAKLVFGATRMPFYAHAWCEVEGTVVNDKQSVRGRYSLFERCNRSKMSEVG